MTRIFFFLFSSMAVFETSAQVSYSTLHNNTTFNNRNITLKPVGTTAGTAGVSGTGAATYTLPLWAPPGTNGMQPGISLTYNSQGGNGMIGMGWSLSGLSSITRVSQDIYHDGAVAPVTFTADDRYALDGVRLILKSGSYGAANAEYVPEMEDFSHIVSYGSKGSGPESFFVRKKDGTLLQYGNTADSRFLTEDGNHVMIWLVNKIIDIHGNYIELVYNMDGRMPRIQEVRYTGNIYTGLNPYNKIAFEYAGRMDTNTGYEGGAAVSGPLLLTKIKAYDGNGTVQKSYELSYGNDGINSYLKEVAEKDRNGNELNPTQFQYGTIPASFSESDVSINMAQQYEVFGGDFDGDGIDEIVSCGAATAPENYTYTLNINVYKKDPNGNYNLAQAWNYGNSGYVKYKKQNYSENSYGLRKTDFNGDGREDIFTIQSTYSPGQYRYLLDQFKIYKGSGSGVIETTPVSVYPTTNWAGKDIKVCATRPQHHESYLIGDFNGDKKSDIIAVFEGGDNNSHYPFMFSEGTVVSSIVNIDFSVFQSHDFKVYVIDFNGDGKDELIFMSGAYCYIYTFSAKDNGDYVAEKIHGGGYPTAWHTVYPGDFNGDGRTDLLTLDGSGTKWELATSTGKAFSVRNFSFTVPPVSTSSFKDHKIIIGDYNGDGKSDVFHGYNVFQGGIGTNAYLDIYYSKGNEFTYEHLFRSKFLGANLPSKGDINGDGRIDLIDRDAYFDPLSILYFKKSGKEHLLWKVASGIGNVTAFTYEPLSNGVNYRRGTDAAYPLMDFQVPFYVARSQQVPDGLGSFTTTYYDYEEAVTHLGGRGFLGFKKVRSENPFLKTASETSSDIDATHYVPHVTGAKTYNTAANQQITHTTNKIDFVQGTVPGTFYQRVLGQTEQNLLTGATTTTSNIYDNNNFGTIISSTTDVNGIETVTTATDYVQPGATTIPCMPDLVTVTRQRSGQTATTDKVKYTYDWMGRVSQKMERYQTNYQVTSTYQYNDFGNLIEKQDVNYTTVSPNPGSLVSYYAYDDKGRFQTSATNQLAQTSYTSWDPVWGKALTVTGIDGITTTNSYDSWGRLSTTKLKANTPAEETATYSYGWSTAGDQYYTLASHPVNPDVKTWYDKLGREVKTETEHLNGQWTASTRTYDVKGNLLTETVPKLSTEQAFTTTYAYKDAYNRLTSVANGFGTTRYSYSFPGNGETKTTVTSPAGQKRSSIIDATGKTLQAEDPGGKLYYSYDSRGNLLTVKHGLNTLMIHTYNKWGIKTNTWDMAAGSATYTYDAFGRLRSEKDAKSQNFSYRYNVLGQLTERTGPEGTTYYTYHGAGFGLANQLAAVSVSANGNNGLLNSLYESYGYDAYGRLIQKDKYIDGDLYSTSYTYDNYDRLIKKEYGDGFFLEYDYNNGFLQNVISPGAPFGQPSLFQAQTINGRGQYEQYTLLNGVTTQNYYDQNYLLYTNSPGVQEWETIYDYTTGNVSFRADYLKNIWEEFVYDDLDRLTETTVHDDGRSIIHPTITIDYDAGALGTTRGNIINKTDIGTFQAQTLGRTSSSKNEAGVISPQVQDISYTPFRKTQSVKETDNASGWLYEQQFTYDASYDRIKTDLYENGSLIQTRLYLDDYEVNIDPFSQNKTYLHYIAGGDGLCALAEVQNQYYAWANNATYHVIYKDHLGSIVAVTDEWGSIEAEQNFDAWGRERDPGTWDYAGAAKVGLTAPWLYRGYTGHEHMPQFSIINMNGRMYDPLLGRMMSPDPFIMGGTQGYNRYSYCRNNPLKYTDPSGYFLKAAMGIIGMMGDYLTNLATGQSDPLGLAYRNVNRNIEGTSNVLQIDVYSDDNTRITAGVDPFSVGLSVNYYQRMGDWNVNASVGIGFVGGPNAGAGVSYSSGNWSFGAGASTNFSTYSLSGGVSFNDGNFNAGYYQTRFGGSSDAALNQWNGGISLGYRNLRIREENDFLLPLKGQRSDRGRTQAWELSYGSMAVGSFIQTNDGEFTSGKEGVTRIASPHWGYNRSKKGYQAWKDGQVFMAPVYFGYNSRNSSSRIGYSAWQVQDIQQNGLHQSFFTPGNQNYYLNYNNFYKGWYLNSSYFNPYSLYGF